MIPQLNVFAEAGYVSVKIQSEASDGPELLAGAAFAFTDLLGAFVDDRMTRIATTNEDKRRFDELRTGVRQYLTR